MKNKIIYTFILFIILSLCCTEPFSVYASNTLIYGCDFEDGFGAWSPLGGQSTLNIDKMNSRYGNASLFVSDRESTWSGPSLTTTSLLRPGSVYYFEAFVKQEMPTEDTISWTIFITNSGGEASYFTIASDSVNNSWKMLRGEFEMPEDVEASNIYFEASVLDTNFYVDGIKIYGKSSVSEKNSGDGSGYSFSFEKSTEGWVKRGAEMNISKTDYFSYSGKSSLYSSDRTKTWHGPTVRLDNIKPGTDYAYSAYVMYNEKTCEENHTFLLVLQYTYEGKIVYSVVSRKELQKGNWSNISGNFTLPQGASDIFLYVQTEDRNDELLTPDDLMPFYIDNVTVTDSTLINKRRRMIAIIIIAVSIVVLIILTIIIHRIIRKSLATKAVLHSASIDEMTGAYNRNTYEERFTFFDEHPDQCRKLCFTVCDVNFLKYINDNYGHEKGDKAIKRCAAVLLKVVGKKGKVYRTGGDEFVCITDIDLTEKIRTEFSIEAQDYQGYPFSAAAGTSSYDSEIDGDKPDIKVILKRSDEEMYKNKQEIKKEFKEYSDK